MRSTDGTKPIYLRGIPAHVVREAKAIAARRGITLAGFVAEAIMQALALSQASSQGQAQGARQTGATRSHARGASADSAPERTEPAQPLDTVDGADDLAREMRWFEQHRERLSRELAGEYVAIIQHEVIDHDADFDALARRVFGRVGTRNVFMPLVGPAHSKAKAPPLRVRSPRVDAARLRPPRATRAR